MKKEYFPEWDNYADDFEEEPAPDRKECPPLTGKKRYIPEGLYEQPWSDVSDAYGAATLTPYYIEALTSEDAGDIEFGMYGLYSATTHQGSVYKASQMAIPFLVDLLKYPEGDAAEMACHILARIALGEQHFITTPASFYTTKYYRSVNKYKKAIKAFYEQTNSLEAMRLLCFLPEMLPDYLDLSYQSALTCSDNEGKAYLRQGTVLLAQGFIAAERNYPNKGYPKEAALIGSELIINRHVKQVRELMATSPSLLVRGCAAVCLAYTGIVDDEVLELLGYLGEQNYDNVPWVWDMDFSNIAKQAWMYSADIETMIESDKFLTLDFTSKTKDGIETKHYSPSERLAAVAARLFPARYQKKHTNLPLLPEDLDHLQRRTLKRIVEAAPLLFNNWQTADINIPLNIYSAKRLLEDSQEKLCERYSDKPLWYLIEEAILLDVRKEIAQILSDIDVWNVLPEIYRPIRTGEIEEQCTLNLKDYYNDKKTLEREILLQSLLADSLTKNVQPVYSFLDEWLEQVKGLEGYDWKNKTPGQRIGISLLALVRAGKMEQKYEALVRPYHPFTRFSKFPTSLLKEVLAATSQTHQEQISKQFQL